MLTPLTLDRAEDFTRACTYERIFGSKALTALKAYGLSDPHVRFFLCGEKSSPTAALCLSEGVLLVSVGDELDIEELAAFIRREAVHEVDIPLGHCRVLQRLLGGELESSYYMVYRGGPIEGDFSDLVPGELPAVFSVLQRSHEYYRTHLDFGVWAAELAKKRSAGLMELYQLERDGQVIGTGSLVSEDDECGVVAAVAVVPEYRHRGLGAHISRFITKRILDKGKTPRLISGEDPVAELYRQVGYETCGRWGELYL